MLLIGGMIFVLYRQWAYDDPFITYRYAQNIAQGAGFVYNPAERVLSTTSPLFALLLAAITPLWPHLPQAAVLLGSLSLAWGGLSLWKLGRAWHVPTLSWLGAGLYPTFPLLLTTLGSEMPLFLALCLAALAAYAGRQTSRCAIFAGLATFTRPDGILLAAILAADYLIRTRPWSKETRASEMGHEGAWHAGAYHAPLLYIAVLLPWLIFAWLYFGSPIPATLAAKQSQGAMEISRSFAEGLVALAGQYARSPSYLFAALLAAAGIPAALLAQKTWLPLLAWTVVHFCAYTVLGVSGYFWYYAPLIPGFLAACGLGISAIQTLLAKAAPRLGAITPVLLIAFLLVGQARFEYTNNGKAYRPESDSRAAIYQAVGEWLHDGAPSTAHIGALEVGIIGYYAGRPMIDFAGLLQPATARQLKAAGAYQDAALWAIEHYRPDYVVLHRAIFPLVEQVMLDQCTLAQQFPGASYNYPGDLDIYHCP